MNDDTNLAVFDKNSMLCSYRALFRKYLSENSKETVETILTLDSKNFLKQFIIIIYSDMLQVREKLY